MIRKTIRKIFGKLTGRRAAPEHHTAHEHTHDGTAAAPTHAPGIQHRAHGPQAQHAGAAHGAPPRPAQRHRPVGHAPTAGDVKSDPHGTEPRSGDSHRRRHPEGSSRPAPHPRQGPAQRHTPRAPAAPPRTPVNLASTDLSPELLKSEFAELGVHASVLRAIGDLGFKRCTPVQAAALPACLAGLDLTGRAQTGTGKTAAFLIAIFHRYLQGQGQRPRAPNAPLGLVLAPTRELAIQIDKDAESLGKYTGIRHQVVYGGMDYQRQAQDLAAGVDLVTATPGRLLDYMQRGIVDLSSVEVLVIDEADRMLDMGFIPDVRRIISRVPPTGKRQTLLFSATLTEDILRLAGSWLRDPTTVEIEPEQVVPDEVEQIVYTVSAKEKLALLLSLLERECGERVLVFRNRRDSADDLTRQLGRYGVKCALLSGDVPQKKRLHVLEAFREARIRVIVATDVAGRGIHVDNISHVINYDLPYEPDDYVHRIGRTGRAGQHGRAVSFACEEGAFVLPEIEAMVKRELKATQPAPEMLQCPAPTHPLPPSEADRESAGGYDRPRDSGRGRSSRPPFRSGRGGGRRPGRAPHHRG